MSYLQKIKDTLQKTAQVTKILFATTLTLAFGATMIWGVKSIFDGKSSEAIALSAEYLSPEVLQQFVNLNNINDDDWCGADAKQGLPFGPCDKPNGTLECGGDGVEAVCVDPDGDGAGTWYGTGNCCAQPPVGSCLGECNRFGCSRSGTCGHKPMMGTFVCDGYTGDICGDAHSSYNPGLSNGLNGRIAYEEEYWCTTQQADTNADNGACVVVYIGNYGTWCVADICNQTATCSPGISNPSQLDMICATEEPKPSASCNYKSTTDADKIVKPLDFVTYEVELEVKDVAVNQLRFVDDYDQTKVTFDGSSMSELAYEGWNCNDNGDKLTCVSANTRNPGKHKAHYRVVINHNATGGILNRVTEVTGENLDSARVTINPNCQETVTVETPKPNFVCHSKDSNPVGSTPTKREYVNPGQIIEYTVNYTIENIPVGEATITDIIPNGLKLLEYRILEHNTNNCRIRTDIVPGLESVQCTNQRTTESNHRLYIKVQVKDNISFEHITNRAIVDHSSASESYCNQVQHYIKLPQVTCDDKTANVQAVRVQDVINYEVKATLANTGADELIIVDDFDETKVSIDPLKVSVTPGAEMITDCSIEDRNGNKVLICSARMFESKGQIEAKTYTFKYSATVLDSAIKGVIENKVIETYALRGGVKFADVNPALKCSEGVDIIEPTVTCVDKVANKASAREGDIIEYTVTLNLQGTSVDGLKFVDDYDESAVEIIADSWKGNLEVDCDDNNGILTCNAYSRLTVLDAIRRGSYSFTYQARVKVNETKLTTNRITSASAIRRGVEFKNDETEASCTEEVQLHRNVPVVDCVSKKASPTENVKVGDTVKYTIKYTSENQPGTVKVIDELDKNSFEFVEYSDASANFCDANKAVNENKIDCNVPGNHGGSIIFYVKVLKAGRLENNAEVIGSENNDNCGTALDVREPISELVCVDKDADKNHVNVGDNVEFTITYRNTGETALQGFVMHDLLPVGMEFVSSENNYCDVPSAWVNAGTGQLVTCTTESVLLPGKEEEFKITVKITNAAGVGKIITNKVTKLYSGDTAGDLESCIENVYVNLPEPLVSITKETIKPQDRTVVLGDDAETPEDYVKYKIIVTNEGPTKLVVVPLKDIFSAHDYKFIEATPKETSVTTFNATTIVYWENLGEIGVGESKEIIITLQALETYWDDVNENVLPNKARVEDVIDENGVEANEDEDSDHVVILGSILGKEIEFSITKDLITENPTTKGKQVKFRIRVTNTGEKEIATIRFVDNYDTAYLTYSDFSNEISHRLDLYHVDAVNGQFIHDNLLYGKEALESGEYIEFEMWFIAENKNGETTNWAKAIVDDKEREDFAKVKIVVEILAKTGANVIIPIAVGVVLTALLSKKVLVKRSDFAEATTDKERK